MKGNLLQAQYPARGFTLVEILVVIMIVVLLMAFVMGAMQWVSTSRMEKQTTIMIERLKGGLAQYKMDNGYYPDGNGDENSTSVIYEALFGDYNHDSYPDRDPKNKDKRNEVYIAELDPNNQVGDPWVGHNGTKYILVDPWRQPLRYRLGWQEKDSKGKKGPGYNPDFDLWSAGVDGATELHNDHKTGANEDDIGYRY